jgi:hypothetical protein
MAPTRASPFAAAWNIHHRSWSSENGLQQENCATDWRFRFIHTDQYRLGLAGLAQQRKDEQ